MDGDINFEISGKTLVHTDTPITVSDIGRYQYHTTDRSGNKIAWLHTPGEDVSLVYTKYLDTPYASSNHLNNITNENLFLVVVPSEDYTVENIASSICQ